MLDNVSHSPDFVPLHPEQPSVNSSILFSADSCYGSVYVLSVYSVSYAVLLPLLVLVLHLGFQQHRKRSKTPNHVDVFTFHSVALQLSEALGAAAFFGGLHADVLELGLIGLGVYKVTVKGQALFHLLTCVDRYLAVVHPIAYLELRRRGGVRIRDFSIGCVWTLSAGWLSLYLRGSVALNVVVYFTLVGGLLVAVLFCNISVLHVLRRPGPGGRGRGDRSKQRAFYAIVVILASLLAAFGGNIVFSGIHMSAMFPDTCVADLCLLLFEFPSRLVLPVLFLHRARKFQLWKQNAPQEM